MAESQPISVRREAANLVVGIAAELGMIDSCVFDRVGFGLQWLDTVLPIF